MRSATRSSALWWLTILATTLLVVLSPRPPRPALASHVAAPAASTATATPLPLAGLDLSGRWSITRSWWRRCSRCGGGSVIRTTPWSIVETGDQIRVDRGPRGQLFIDANGLLRLNLSGLESE